MIPAIFIIKKNWKSSTKEEQNRNGLYKTGKGACTPKGVQDFFILKKFLIFVLPVFNNRISTV